MLFPRPTEGHLSPKHPLRSRCGAQHQQNPSRHWQEHLSCSMSQPLGELAATIHSKEPPHTCPPSPLSDGM